jgi:hypothetical protein
MYVVTLMEVFYSNLECIAVVGNHSTVWIPRTQRFLAIYNGSTSAPTGGLAALNPEL